MWGISRKSSRFPGKEVRFCRKSFTLGAGFLRFSRKSFKFLSAAAGGPRTRGRDGEDGLSADDADDGGVLGGIEIGDFRFKVLRLVVGHEVLL
jgi:hypothetical protein